MKTVLNSAKFLFKSLNHSCYCKEGAMFTCAKEKVTFVIKNTCRHCNCSACLRPREGEGASRLTCQKHSMRDLCKKPFKTLEKLHKALSKSQDQYTSQFLVDACKTSPKVLWSGPY